jgi:hypothetical protein
VVIGLEEPRLVWLSGPASAYQATMQPETFCALEMRSRRRQKTNALVAR